MIKAQKEVSQMDGQNTVLVCVTPQETSKALVDAGRAIAEENSAALEVVSVLPIDGFNEKVNNPEVLDRLYRYAKDASGDMAVYFSDDPTLTVAAHIAKTKPLLLVTGYPEKTATVLFRLFIFFCRSLQSVW